ncbi:hypothetical protein JHK84_045137 [Glycine max]|nr:hypothetical protein JHK86_045077 [Glycine max]KAG5108230.1 hypothetical protein JHK84_045137 [Glycine max]
MQGVGNVSKKQKSTSSMTNASSPSLARVRIEPQAIQQNIDFKGLVCLDVETRWSFTYLMLDATLNHQKAFEEFLMEEMKYAYELRNEGGVPISED